MKLCYFKDLQLNRVTIHESSPQTSNGIDHSPIKKQTKKYDLAPKDKFWNQHKIRLALSTS